MSLLQKRRRLENENDDEFYRRDMAARPDAEDDDYEEAPIEGFGERLLQSLGHRKGAGLGAAKTGPVAPYEYIARPGRLGLGAAPKENAAGAGWSGRGRARRPEDLGREERGSMVLPVGPDGRVRHVRTLDEKLVSRKDADGIVVGARVAVTRGRHEGVSGVLLSLGEDGAAKVELANGERVRVTRGDLASGAAGAGEAPAPAAAHAAQGPPDDERPWLAVGIRVRVISKTLGGGQHYNIKGRVVDLVGPRTATVHLDNGTVLDAVAQADTETLVPRVGGRVKVVLGRHRGRIGQLLEKSSGRQEAAVQLTQGSTVKVVRLYYEAISEAAV